ncbi:hypothetical protein DPMN_123109 [Dreissena polymorpha]|uniref:DNA repair protein REV1 n=1 Tax=Dreissena polymorpha TaxID=45954 RepID=A0A9D4JR75_DREPO|nr:hypothetical protein DPMN_123109 [Dreissena polymorpha]
MSEPSSDELKRLMMLHGGTYETYLYRTRVTHVIATNLPDSKVKEIRGLKVVTPEWITDSIAAGKLLSYTKYQLYTAQSGLQKGLQSFSVQIDAEKSIQSTPNQIAGSFWSKGSEVAHCRWQTRMTHQPVYHTGLSPKEEFSENLKDFSGMETSLQHNGPAENFHAKAQSRSPAKAVTHSLGKGATVDPRSDLGFERREWAKNVSNQKREKSGLNAKMDSLNEENMSFPDQSESDTDDDVTDDVTDVSNFSRTSESFHSMAELASCSYEARKAGVKNGMFMGRARQLCPDLVTIPYDFEGYNTVSRVLYDTVASFTHDIEAVSCDEMLVDCTDVLADTGAMPLEFAAMVREEIYKKTGCCASAGLGSSILLARLATRKAKPNGQFHLTPALVGEYIKDQSVRDIPGVGWSLARRFEAMKVTTCGDLQRFSLDALQKDFGPKTGQSLFKYCRGQDDRPIKIEQQRKSVSAEVNYGIRFTTDMEFVTTYPSLSHYPWQQMMPRLSPKNLWDCSSSRKWHQRTLGGLGYRLISWSQSVWACLESPHPLLAF